MAGPPSKEGTSPRRVIAEQIGDAETAHELECCLDGFAHLGALAVGAEQVDGETVELAADRGLQRLKRLAQRGVGAGRDPDLERGGEQRPGERLGQQVDDALGAVGCVREGRQLRRATRRPAAR